MWLLYTKQIYNMKMKRKKRKKKRMKFKSAFEATTWCGRTYFSLSRIQLGSVSCSLRSIEFFVRWTIPIETNEIIKSLMNFQNQKNINSKDPNEKIRPKIQYHTRYKRLYIYTTRSDYFLIYIEIRLWR